RFVDDSRVPSRPVSAADRSHRAIDRQVALAGVGRADADTSAAVDAHSFVVSGALDLAEDDRLGAVVVGFDVERAVIAGAGAEDAEGIVSSHRSADAAVVAAGRGEPELAVVDAELFGGRCRA